MEAAGGLPPPPPEPEAITLPTIADVLNDPIPNLPTPVTMPPPTDPPRREGDAPVTNPQSDTRDADELGTDSEHEDSEDDEDDVRRWYPISEDKSAPCSDELKYIESKEEHSATDHAYWEKQTFFDLDDPEILPLDSGRIEWLVQGFNGTKESPNNETVMRSKVVQIGGLDWQIKFYPRGVPGSEYLSVFIECVSMLSDDFVEREDFDHLPFPAMKMPFMKDVEKIQRRRSIAAQVSVVMYNPEEPRVYEHQAEAHQFHKGSKDFGWKYFTRMPRYEFHLRQHGQRQAILRGDKLAFSAYIRTVQDPTGCMWEHGDQTADQITSVTGLRPFSRSLVYTAATLPILHFAPLRKLVQDLPTEPGDQDTGMTAWLQLLLLKMYSRKRSDNYGNRGPAFDVDVMEMLWKLGTAMSKTHGDSPLLARFNELLGTFHSEQGAACGSNRLNTKDYPSIQQAVDNHPTLIARPALLTLELQRQEHDKKERKWKKLTNKVKCQETLTVGGTSYTLFAFITHCGHLRSCRYNSYVRPRGPGKGWYAYQDSKVTRLTEKQARERHSGVEDSENRPRTPEDGYDSPFSEFHVETSEVACAVMYVRDDMTDQTFNVPDVEEWAPSWTTFYKESPNEVPKSAVHENFTFSERPVLGNGQIPIADEETARLEQLRARIEEAAGRTTPDPVLMDGDDVVMKDADEDSSFGVEQQDSAPVYGSTVFAAGTKDWLGQAYYEGSFSDKGYFHGGGHLIATNGDEYLGEFKDGVYSGYGKLIYALTGNVYEGDFLNGMPEGRGKLTEAATTGNVYEGGFKEGRKHGEFTLTGKVTDEDQSSCHICYDKDITTAFYDCGHVVACRECASQIDVCPVCRRRVVARLQLYGVRVSNC